MSMRALITMMAAMPAYPLPAPAESPLPETQTRWLPLRHWRRTEDREEKLAKAAAKRLRRQAMRLIDRGSLWYCVMCPDEPWVGNHDAVDLYGECPACGSGVGVFRVERDFPRGPAAIIVHRKIVTGQVDRLDEVPR